MRRDTRSRSASEMSCGVPTFIVALFRFLCRRRDERRREARRWSAIVVSHGFLKLNFPLFWILCRRPDNRSHDPRRRGAGIASYVVLRLFFALREILNRRLDYKRSDAWRRSANVVSFGVPRFVTALSGLCRRRNDMRQVGLWWVRFGYSVKGKSWQLTTSRRSASSFRHCVVYHPDVLLRMFEPLRRNDGCHDVKRRLPASCRMASQGLCCLRKALALALVREHIVIWHLAAHLLATQNPVSA